MQATTQNANIDLLIHSSALFSGVAKGFALLFAADRVIGCKRYTEGHVVVRAPLDEKATKLVADLQKHREFEILFSDLASVELKRPGTFKPGAIVFHAASGDQTVKVSGTLGTGAKSVQELVAEALEQHCPGKLTR
jgi:hypothetical protein